jgi:hypothetical protein
LTNFCDEDWDEASAWEFPESRQTSEILQQLIRDCTKGSLVYHIYYRTGMTRVCDKVYPRNQTRRKGEKEASVEETVDIEKKKTGRGNCTKWKHFWKQKRGGILDQHSQMTWNYWVSRKGQI